MSLRRKASMPTAHLAPEDRDDRDIAVVQAFHTIRTPESCPGDETECIQRGERKPFRDARAVRLRQRLHRVLLRSNERFGLAQPKLAQRARWWRGLDSNQRTPKRADLQSAGFNHSPTPPQGPRPRRQLIGSSAAGPFQGSTADADCAEAPRALTRPLLDLERGL